MSNYRQNQSQLRQSRDYWIRRFDEEKARANAAEVLLKKALKLLDRFNDSVYSSPTKDEVSKFLRELSKPDEKRA